MVKREIDGLYYITHIVAIWDGVVVYLGVVYGI